MAKKFLYIGADNLATESVNAYEVADFISSSAGAGDAGKPIVLDAEGHIDSSMINDADVDHGSLGGLSDDDHSQYHNDTRGDARYYTQTKLGSTSLGEGASLIGVQDANSYFTATNQEGVNNELYELIGQPGVSYVASGAIAKGDLCYVSANDQVSVLSSLSGSERGVGLAYAAALDTAAVKVSANDIVIAGILSSATAGAPQFWTGSAHSETAPSGSAGMVWKTGVAKNATDLHVEVEFVKRNATA